MLILSRHLNEKIIINDKIVINIVEINGDKVKIGIDAPKDCKIIRKELAEEIKNANIEAANASFEDVNKFGFFLKKTKEL